MTAAPEQQLEAATSQLRRYAADMKKLVDQERRKSRELAAAKERLERLDRLKSDFLTFISHELRTPLNHMAAVDLFDPDASAEEQAEVAGMIREGYARLDRFIRTGLEYFEWTSRESEAAPGERCDWRAVLRDAARAFPELAVEAPGRSGIACIDAARLRRVFSIVLHNASKHGGGRVTVTAGQPAPGRVAIDFTDQGPGIAPAMAEEVFRPFTILGGRNHSSGSGLSLALARAMLAAAGGSIRVIPRDPPGAVFRVELEGQGETSLPTNH